MKPGGRMEAYQPQPKHPMAQAIGLEAMCWHFFGAFRFADGAAPILNLDNDEGCMMYDQRLPGGGPADRFDDRSRIPITDAASCRRRPASSTASIPG